MYVTLKLTTCDLSDPVEPVFWLAPFLKKKEECEHTHICTYTCMYTCTCMHTLFAGSSGGGGGEGVV